MTPRTYAAAAAACAAVIVYGSFVPFHARPVPLAEAAEQFRGVLARPVRVESYSDWAANVALGVPLAFALAGAAAADRGRRRALLAAPLILIGCAALAAGVEFGQLWFPPRQSSLNDIVAQALGAAAGLAAWLAFGQRFTDWLRGLAASAGTTRGAARLLPPYLAALVLVHVMPLDLTVRPAELWHKVKDGRVRLDPLPAAADLTPAFAEKQLWNAVYFLPLGLLLARLADPRWRTAGSAPAVLGFGLAAALTVEALQFFVASRNCDARDVPAGAAAVVLGWVIGAAWPVGRPASAAWRWSALGAWAAAAVCASWLPFDFDGHSGLAARRWAELSWLPLADYQAASPLQAFDEFLKRLALFAPLGALAWRAAGGAGVLLTAVVAVGLEAGQLWLPGRTASVSDSLIAAAAGWVGAAVARSVAGRRNEVFRPGGEIWFRRIDGPAADAGRPRAYTRSRVPVDTPSGVSTARPPWPN